MDKQSDDTNEPGTPNDQNAMEGHLVGTAENRARAVKLFSHAQKAAETRNYDYAVELYVSGLALWPDAIEEGLKKLRVAATARKLDGGKPPGFITARKYPTGGKDAAKSLNNALHLYGLNPSNLSYLEQILKLAAKAGCDAVAQWIAPVLTDAYNSAKKLPSSHYQVSCESMDQTAELAMQFQNDTGAIEILRANIATAQIWARYYPDAAEPLRAEGDASGKLTILKGRFDKAEDYTESLKDAQRQHDLHDEDKRVHTIGRTQQLIDKARQDWEDNRDVANKLLKLVDLMIRIEGDKNENEAIDLLDREFAGTKNYIFKQKSDEMHIRKQNRRHRELAKKARAHPENAEHHQALETHAQDQIEMETRIFEGRLKQYPTDLRIKFHLALRYFQARRYDEAIPLFQQARTDARLMAESQLYIGRCFYNKQFHDQATEILRRATEKLEGQTGPLVLELNYWLARSLESAGKPAEAKKVYGHLIQMDYNFRDAREHLERLVNAED